MTRVASGSARAAWLGVAIAGVGCGAATPPAGSLRGPPSLPAWERPGLAGSVRPEMGSPQPGERAPDFELPALAGGALRLSSLRGSWVVLHFTATWCPYCDAEMTHLGEIADAYARRNVKVLVVDLQEDPGVWSAYASARVSPSLLAAQDRAGTAAERFAPPRAQPSFVDRAQVLFDATLLLDPDGVIRLFLLPDTAHFDPSFRGVRAELDRQVGPLAEGAGLEARTSRQETKSEPPKLLPPEDVVGLSTEVDAPQASGEAAVVVRFAIAPGYHIMSNRPRDRFSIPTDVRIASAGDLVLGPPEYPPSTVYEATWGSIAVFEGRVDVRLPLRPAARAAVGVSAAVGTSATTSIDVRYQACTAGSCLPPVTKRIDVGRRSP